MHDERLGAARPVHRRHLHASATPTTPTPPKGLTKRIGVTDGISDVPWHKDCSPGGHSYGCCGLTVGLCLTPADRESGELGVVAGSHRANVQGGGVRADMDLPRRRASRRRRRRHHPLLVRAAHEPAARESRTPRRLHGLRARAPTRRRGRKPVDRDTVRRDRADLDDAGRRLNQRGYGAKVQQFELDG